MGKERDFPYSTVDKYLQGAKTEGNHEFVVLWNEIKQDKQKHLARLRECLKQESKEKKIPA